MKKAAAKVANNRFTLIVGAAIGLALTFAVGTRAIDTGSWWEYLGCLIFLGLAIKLLIRSFKK